MKAKTLIYTFRTFRYVDSLQNLGCDIFVFDKMKQSYADLQSRLGEYERIIGVAEIRRSKRPIFESAVINKFGKKGRVVPGAPEQFRLFVPDYPSIKVNSSTYTSYCNWAGYKIQLELERMNSQTKHAFLHISSGEVAGLKELLSDILNSF